MASLADIDRVLALFAEGIAGRPVHIKSASEFAGEPSAEVRHGVNEVAGVNGIDGIDARHDAKSVYLPDRIEHFADDELNSALYRVAVLDELGFREFGSYRFDMETARQRMPGLASRESSVIGLRESDLGIFFHSFEHPALARSLFRIIETARIRAAVERRYPGTRRYRHALREHLEGIWTLPAGAIATELAMLRAALLGLAAASRLYPFAVAVLTPDADVYTTAAATATCLEALAPESVDALPDDSGTDGDPTMEWLQREARLDNWDEELANLDGEIAAMEFAESAQLEQIKAGNASRDAGDLRDAGAALVVERDQLKRRIDMERSSVRRALGDEHKHTASYRYDEWDYHNGVYLRAWCRLYEERLQPEEAKDTGALLAVVRPYVRAARRQFEQVRPTGYQRVKKTPDGDELDLDAIVATRADLRVGASPDERVYSRRERLRRDVGAVLLVDLSASTDDIIPDASASRSPHDSAGAKSSLGGRERVQERVQERAQDMRDPFFDEREEYDFAARMAAEAAKRRIIDILRESVLLLGTALESLGDRYAVYGFSGYGRDCVEFYVAKEFDDPFDDAVVDAIAAMKPERSTRMGPAVRHAATKLAASGAALKVLMIVSDGFPQDHDYGPDRGEHEYGVQDTGRALAEAQAQGIETFCVTVDRSGHDYLRRMCADDRYLVIEETAELPAALQKAYRQLTRI